jgi:short-subunit dehydrogenase
MERREGCVLNIASRAGTVVFPFNTTYSVSKAAMIRMTNCLQMEMNVLGYENIHMYALHPGAVASAITSKGEDARLNVHGHGGLIV